MERNRGEIPAPYHDFILNVGKGSSARSLLQCTRAGKDVLVHVMWNLISEILKFEDRRFPREHTRNIVLKLLDIRYLKMFSLFPCISSFIAFYSEMKPTDRLQNDV